MKPFNFDPSHDQKCPLCNTDEIKDATLVPIAGTEEGYNAYAIQVHVDCLRDQLWYYPNNNCFIAVPKGSTSI